MYLSPNAAKTALTCSLIALLTLAGAQEQTRVMGIDFNCNASLAAPSQGGFRIIAGGKDGARARSHAINVNGVSITVSTDGSAGLGFTGSNHDATRLLPGGPTTLPALVADHIHSTAGNITLTIEDLPAGNYQFISYHLDTFSGTGLGFAQGSSASTPQTLAATIAGEIVASVQPTALSAAGLQTTAISDHQIPTLQFPFTSDGSTAVVIHLHGQLTNPGGDTCIFLNGFEIRKQP